MNANPVKTSSRLSMTPVNETSPTSLISSQNALRQMPVTEVKVYPMAKGDIIGYRRPSTFTIIDNQQLSLIGELVKEYTSDPDFADVPASEHKIVGVPDFNLTAVFGIGGRVDCLHVHLKFASPVLIQGDYEDYPRRDYSIYLPAIQQSGSDRSQLTMSDLEVDELFEKEKGIMTKKIRDGVTELVGLIDITAYSEQQLSRCISLAEQYFANELLCIVRSKFASRSIIES